MTGQPINFNAWERVTEALPWGVQHALYDTLALASEGSVKIVHGLNEHQGRPCLINAISAMLTVTPRQDMPQHYSELVWAFDSLNNQFEQHKINTEPYYVSELGAEILLQHFAPLKEADLSEPEVKVEVEAPYIEPSDEMWNDMLAELDKPYVPLDNVSETDKADAIARVNAAIGG